ncbi:hypothetical protein [Hoeflea sp.]|nr:hypothetical protein [Hoeflea sp.]
MMRVLGELDVRPMAGITLLAVMVLDMLVISRVPALKRVLS